MGFQLDMQVIDRVARLPPQRCALLRATTIVRHHSARRRSGFRHESHVSRRGSHARSVPLHRGDGGAVGSCQGEGQRLDTRAPSSHVPGNLFPEPTVLPPPQQEPDRTTPPSSPLLAAALVGDDGGDHDRGGHRGVHGALLPVPHARRGVQDPGRAHHPGVHQAGAGARLRVAVAHRRELVPGREGSQSVGAVRQPQAHHRRRAGIVKGAHTRAEVRRVRVAFTPRDATQRRRGGLPGAGRASDRAG